ncbi:hypothetical protein CDAR_96641 [Caerostris darwini]|uniref:Uncharacterized protein n=1 Tax=Caerostris darwini TaxID=1538125 RepID=A0AAV4QXK6_9ARAC|nr:hypothetical protein CDAR_96641 [Caerostris darwini]
MFYTFPISSAECLRLCPSDKYAHNGANEPPLSSMQGLPPSIGEYFSTPSIHCGQPPCFTQSPSHPRSVCGFVPVISMPIMVLTSQRRGFPLAKGREAVPERGANGVEKPRKKNCHNPPGGFPECTLIPGRKEDGGECVFQSSIR